MSLCALDVVAQHELAGIGIAIDLLVHPVGNLVPSQVVVEQRERHDQRDLLSPIPVDLIQEFFDP